MKGLFWRIWAVLLLLSILWLGWCMKTSPPVQAQSGIPDEIRAKRFVVVDDEGSDRAMLETLQDGSTRLRLLDAQDKPRAELHVLTDGTPALGLLDAQRKTRIALGTRTDGSWGIVVNDSKGRVLFSEP